MAHKYIKKDSLVQRSVIIGVFLTLLALIGWSISISPLQLSIGFFGALVTVFVVNAIYDYLSAKQFFHLESFVASLLIVALAYSIVIMLGGSTQNFTIVSTIELVIIASVLEYAGVIISDMITGRK
jgi:hypothetical protein